MASPSFVPLLPRPAPFGPWDPMLDPARNQPQQNAGRRSQPAQLASKHRTQSEGCQGISSTTCPSASSSSPGLEEVNAMVHQPTLELDDSNCDVPSLEPPEPQTPTGHTKSMPSKRRARRGRKANLSRTTQTPRSRGGRTQGDNTETRETRETRAKTKYARHLQNRVGKRYRDRLGAEFEKLQAALCIRPDAEQQDEHMHAVVLGQKGKTGGSRRSINKTKIVDLARERVRELLRDWEAVKAEREALLRERAVEGW